MGSLRSHAAQPPAHKTNNLGRQHVQQHVYAIHITVVSVVRCGAVPYDINGMSHQLPALCKLRTTCF